MSRASRPGRSARSRARITSISLPTALERLVWGFGDGSTLHANETPLGNIGSVICWENDMPLLRAAMYAKGVEIYCAPTVDDYPSKYDLDVVGITPGRTFSRCTSTSSRWHRSASGKVTVALRRRREAFARTRYPARRAHPRLCTIVVRWPQDFADVGCLTWHPSICLNHFKWATSRGAGGAAHPADSGQ
jgi:hypothetical protein